MFFSNLNDLGYLAVGSHMRRIYDKLQMSGDKIYEAIGLDFKSSWFPVYYALAITNRPLTVKEITQQISYTRITVKNVVRELTNTELVTVVENREDKRSKLIDLTKKGNEFFIQLQDVWLSFSVELERLFKSYNHDFMGHLIQVNDKLEASSFEKRVLRNYYEFNIQNAEKENLKTIGELMVEVYSALKGFPSAKDQPEYYDKLKNVGAWSQNENVELIASISKQGHIGGAVVFFKDMVDYGSGGTATKVKNACGFRLLAVNPKMRGLGLGRELTIECIQRAKELEVEQVVIHTTKAMKTAWRMYERLGFQRSLDLDFMQGELPVYGFRLYLSNDQ